MEQPTDMLIRERAYAIWLREGCPPDAAERHWQQALDELAAMGNGRDIAMQPDGEGPSPVIVAGPEAHENEMKPAPKAKRKPKAAPSDDPVIVAGPKPRAKKKTT